MDSLYRELAPVPGSAWEQVEAEAGQAIKRVLAARKLVDFDGPRGWQTSSVDRGRSEALKGAPGAGIEARLRQVQPLVELRIPFELQRSEIDAIDQGAADADLQPVIDAAREIALAEDKAVFYGFGEAQIAGIFESAADYALPLTEDYTCYPDVVAEGLNRLRLASVDGPYAIALGPRCYTGLTQTRDAGFPVIEHVRRLLEGPIVWAPAVDGAVLLSMRGGDFELTVGQDFSIGYLEHSATSVRLFIQESFTFRINAPEAAIPLRYGSARKK
jgi:uncharacterized linocin/CFP29 family protein